MPHTYKPTQQIWAPSRAMEPNIQVKQDQNISKNATKKSTAFSELLEGGLSWPSPICLQKKTLGHHTRISLNRRLRCKCENTHLNVTPPPPPRLVSLIKIF